MTSYIHTINPQIASLIGESESILLNQLEYWISKCGRDIDNLDGKWIYNSYKKWSEQFTYWSTSKLRRTIKSLENLGLIKSIKVNSKKWNQTKWYSIDYHKYNKLLEDKHLNLSSSKTSSIIYNDVTKSSSNSSEAIGNTKLKNKDLLTTSRLRENHQINENVKFTEITPIINKNTQKSPEVCICSKWTNQSVQNEQMLIVTKNNYTKNNSSKNKISIKTVKEEDFPINFIKEENIVNQMLYLWNKVFESSVNPIRAYSNKKNQQTLFQLYKTVFNSDLNNWKEYALKVNSSQFLMGEKETRNNFKAIFSWLIKEETIEKIQNGEYGVGDRELDMNNVSKNIEEKKEEVVNKMDKKISEYIKLNIDETKERKEFDEYVKTHKTEIKDDEYGVLGMIKHISYHSLFKISEYEVLKESLYESYVMKKYLNITKMEARKKIRNKMKEIIKDKGRKERILEILDKKEKEIECLELSRHMTKIGLHSIL
jgi:hypothetical protein